MESYKVNWFLTSECNLSCDMCMRDESAGKIPPMEKARKLVDAFLQNGVERVTISGGEPTVVPQIYKIIDNMKEKEIYVSLHTNGTANLDDIKFFNADIMSLPIDSLKPSVNRQMRSLSNYNEVVMSFAKKCKEQGKNVAFKTVASRLNRGEIRSIYDGIDGMDFEYWKVYQFRALSHGKRVEKTFGLSNKEFAKIEKTLSKLGDERVKAVSAEDGRMRPYIFAYNNGNIGTSHPTEERNVIIGNIYRSTLSKLYRNILLMKA